jgi:Tfp pilus assembly protein PilO
MKMTTRTLDMACVTGLLALALLGAFWVVKSSQAMAGRVSRHNQAVIQRRGELKTAQAVLGRLDVALKQNENALEELRERLPESHSAGEFLGDLDAVMARHGVDLSEMTPGTPVHEELCVRTPLQLACRGQFGGLHAVLYEIETMQRLVRIDRASIRRDSLAGKCYMDAACSVYGR